jgi:hypothetical protein
MKHLGKYSDLFRSFAVLTLVMFSYNCTKTIHDRRPTAINTPESREYFGFVLNGRHFISEARTNNVSGSCTFTASYGNKLTFQIESSHSAPNCVGGTIEIVLDSVEIKEGEIYTFGTPGRRKNYLTCFFANQCSKPAVELGTRDGSFGFIKIKKYKPDIKVIQGVFSCIVTNDHGVTYQIADGYFDRHYTQQ